YNCHLALRIVSVARFIPVGTLPELAIFKNEMGKKDTTTFTDFVSVPCDRTRRNIPSCLGHHRV
ncbi:MAG: hypothetical protein M3M86_03485, partial [Thermoproteota archaeon]|nr:hypothetical protein [Thermoproteota archaeon]